MASLAKKVVKKTMKNTKPTSPSFQVDMNDVVNLGKNALLVGGAAAVSFIGLNLSDIDFGANGIIVVPFISAALDYLVKYMKDNVDEEYEQDDRRPQPYYPPYPHPDDRSPRYDRYGR